MRTKFLNSQTSLAVYRNMDLETILQRAEWNFQPGTRILFPSDPSFASETERWNINCAPTFKAAIRPGSEDDSQKYVGLVMLGDGRAHSYMICQAYGQIYERCDIPWWRLTGNYFLLAGSTRHLAQDPWLPLGTVRHLRR